MFVILSFCYVLFLFLGFYMIVCVLLFLGGTEIEVKLVLPWRDYGKIEYITSAVWPLEKNK